MRLRRRPFADLVERQLALFAREYGTLLDQCEAALEAHDAERGREALAEYERYLDLAEDARDALAGMRDAYALTLDAAVADAYRDTFTTAARRRFPRISLELD